MKTLNAFRIIVFEIAVVGSCLWESGFLSWVTHRHLVSPGDHIEAGPAIPIFLDIGGNIPHLAGLWQGCITLLMAACIYIIAWTIAAMIGRRLGVNQ